jgi:hypothetical protein
MSLSSLVDDAIAAREQQVDNPLRSLFWIALVSAALVQGCTNLAAVRTYADETKKVSAAFDPMLGGSTTSCVERIKRRKLITSRKFDAEQAEKDAKALCKSIDEDNKVISALNDLLGQYADTLAALADDKLPSYKKELDGLKDSLGKVKKNSGAALIDKDKLGAVASLMDSLSRIATEQMQKSAIRELLGHEDGIKGITDALKDYADLNYRGWLNDETREIGSLKSALEKSQERLAANYIQTLLLEEQQQIDARAKTIDAFVKSVAALRRAHSEVRVKFDEVDDKELRAKLADFATEVAQLRKQLKDAF